MPILDQDADLRAVQFFLRRQPALNTVPLGLVSRARTTAGERSNLFVATVERDGDIVAAALRADFPKLTLAAAGTDSDIGALARLVHSAMPDLPCVLGLEGQVEAFAAEWERLTDVPRRQGTMQRLHVLERVHAVTEVRGIMRPANRQDLALVLDWFGAFQAEALPEEAGSDGSRRGAVARYLEAGSLFLWTDPEPVCMAGAREFGEGLARIGPVFTPIASRRRGYGGALTASVSQHMLDLGCTACCLFTDLHNSTSNHIYREVGYRPMADFNEYWFGAQGVSVP